MQLIVRNVPNNTKKQKKNGGMKMFNQFEELSKDDLRKIYSTYMQSKKDGTKCKEFVSYGKRYRREMGAEQIMPLSTAIDIVESMFFKEIAERYFDSSNIKDKTAAADEVLRIYETLTVHQKRLVLQKILKKEDND
jgi:hypothetical protein